MAIKLDNKLLLIEGIPGSGKSTLTNRIHTYYKDMDVNMKAYNEGDLHPVDFAWCGYLTIDEYNKLLKKYYEYKEEIIKNAFVDDQKAIIAYLDLKNVSDELIDYLESKEIYDGMVTADRFKEIHIDIYNQFSQKAAENDITYLFECVALQNQVNELLLINNKSEEFISEYIQKLMKTVEPINPLLIYLQQNNVRETLSIVAKQRLSKDKSKCPDWIDKVTEYVCESTYGKEHHLCGFDGVVEYLEIRQRIEMDIINQLPIKTVIIENIDYDYDAVFEKIITAINK